jgi:hypothetical protein
MLSLPPGAIFVRALVIWPSPAGVALGAAGVPGTITQGPVGHKQFNALIVARDIAQHTRDVSPFSAVQQLQPLPEPGK